MKSKPDYDKISARYAHIARYNYNDVRFANNVRGCDRSPRTDDVHPFPTEKKNDPTDRDVSTPIPCRFACAAIFYFFFFFYDACI